MRKIKNLLLLAFLVVTLLPGGNVNASAPTAYDLIAAVNDLRANYGLTAIEADSALMNAAQTQADYIAGFCEFSCNGHLGPGGNYARDRAVAAGYPLTTGMNVIENWDSGNSATTLSEVIYEDWADEDHMNTMLHPDAVAVGAGVSVSADGSLYFILDVAVLYGSGGSSGSGSSANTGIGATIPTTAVTAPVALVQVATPQADGSIIHIVDTGQALWNIAAAYDVTVDQLLDLNNISNNIINVGQEILVQMASTATPTPPATETPRPPTRTPIPAQTAEVVETQAGTTENGDNNVLGVDRQTMGLVLVLICGAGLALVVLGNINKDKGKKKQPPKSE
jgi:LysM repeat protein